MNELTLTPSTVVVRRKKTLCFRIASKVKKKTKYCVWNLRLIDLQHSWEERERKVGRWAWRDEGREGRRVGREKGRGGCTD